MGTDHKVKLAIALTPVIGLAPPEVLISVPEKSYQNILNRDQRFEIEFTASTASWLKIELINKSNLDHATAVIIDKIEFFGISHPKFIWQAQYRPVYPEPWFSQQNPKPPEIVTNTNYLGWNGVWRLDFGVPVFTWMHQIQNLGWTYD